MCCDYEMPLEDQQENLIEKEKKIIQNIGFRKTEENPIPA